MPRNDFYNAIRQLGIQKAQEEAPQTPTPAQTSGNTGASVQTPELDRATGNTPSARTAPLKLVSLPNAPQIQQTPQAQQTQPAEQPARTQSTAERLGRRPHQREVDNTPVNLAGETDPKSELELLAQGGNVNLTGRARVSAGELENMGWNTEPGTTAITPIQTYTANGVTANFTPVQVDEAGSLVRIMFPDELERYAQEVLSGRRKDDRKLQVGGTFEGAFSQDALQAAEQARAAQRKYYDVNYQGTVGQQMGAFFRGLGTAPMMSREELEALPPVVQEYYRGAAELAGWVQEAPLAPAIFAENAAAAFLNSGAESQGLSPTDSEHLRSVARAGQMTGLAAGAGVTRAGGGVAKAVQMIEDLASGGAWHDPLTEDVIKNRDGYTAKIKKETEGWSDKQKQYYEYAIEAFRMLPSIAIGWANVGGTTVAQAGSQLAGGSNMLSRFMTGLLTNPIYYETAIEVTGNSYEDALKGGADEGQAALYATVNGLLNAMIEVGGADELPKIIRGKEFDAALLAAVKAIPREAMEEVSQGWVEKLAQNVVLNANNEIVGINDKNAVFSFARGVMEAEGGAVLGGLFSGGNLIVNTALNSGRAQQGNNPRQAEAAQLEEQQRQEQLTPITEAVLNNQQIDIPEEQVQSETSPSSVETLESEPRPVIDSRDQTAPVSTRAESAPSARSGAVQDVRAGENLLTDERETLPEVDGREAEQARNEARREAEGEPFIERGEGQPRGNTTDTAELEQEYKRRYEEFKAAVNEGNLPTNLLPEIQWLSDAREKIGVERADQIIGRTTKPGANPRAQEQAQSEETLNTPQAPESAESAEGQAGTSPIAEAILQRQREQDSWLDRVEADEAMDNPQASDQNQQTSQDTTTDDDQNNAQPPAPPAPPQGPGVNPTNSSNPSGQSVNPNSNPSAGAGPNTNPNANPSNNPNNNPNNNQNNPPANPNPQPGTPPVNPNNPGGNPSGNPNNPGSNPNNPGANPSNPNSNPSGNPSPNPNPNQNQNGTKLSQTVETVRDAKPTPKDFADLINRNIVDGKYRYFPITNSETTQQAMDEIMDQGWDRALRNWQRDVDHGKSGARVVAIGQLLFNNAVNSGNQQLASDILYTFREMGTRAGQTLQAFRILQDMDPLTRLYSVLGNVRKLSERFAHDPNAIQVAPELAEKFRTAATEDERLAVEEQIANDLARQITEKRTKGVAFREMWTALRYLNMLGNVRTLLVRNPLGNVGSALEYTTKNTALWALERLYSKLNGGKYTPRTAFGVGEYMSAAMQDGKALHDVIQGQSRYNDNVPAADRVAQNAIDRHRIFAINSKSNALNKAVNTLLWLPEGARRGTKKGMDVGDYIFSLPQYARYMAGYVKAHGMDAATFNGIIDGSIQPTEEQNQMLDEARAWGIQEAQEATFKDNNAFVNWITKIGRRPDTNIAGKIIAEGISPFRKTPGNVLLRGAEYSPLGWFDTTVKILQNKMGKGNVTASDILDSAAKSLTGTGLFLLGMFLRNKKRVTGTDDDEKQRAYNSLRGKQEWAINFPDGSSYTLDWVTPNSIPFFMGVQLQNYIEEDGFQVTDFAEALPSMSQVMINQSFLQGANDTLSGIKFGTDDTPNLMKVALQAGLSYALQGLSSTAGGQIERIVQEKRYTTWRNPELKGMAGIVDATKGKLSAKIPGWDYNQIEYVDAWGRTESTGNEAERVMSNLLSPGYYSKDDSTEVDDELQRLYDAGMSNVFPQTTAASEKIPTFDSNGRKDGERYMTKDELVRYQKVRGQTSLEMVKDLMDSNIYDSMTDEARAAAISEIYSYAKTEAARAVERTVPNSYGDITRTSNPAAYIGMQKAFSTATSDKYNRDYDAVDDLMQQYGKMPMDVRKLLGEKVDGLGKVYEASKAGISSKTYYTTTDAIKAITPPEGNANPVLWQKAEYIGGLKYMPDSQKDFFMKQYFSDGSQTKYTTCRDQGYRPNDIAAFYKLMQTIKGDDANGDGRADTGSKKTKVIAAAVKYGFSQAQAEYLYGIWK